MLGCYWRFYGTWGPKKIAHLPKLPSQHEHGKLIDGVDSFCEELSQHIVNTVAARGGAIDKSQLLLQNVCSGAPFTNRV